MTSLADLMVCSCFTGGLLHIGQKGFGGELDLKDATAPRLGHSNIACQSSAEMLNKQNLWNS